MRRSDVENEQDPRDSIHHLCKGPKKEKEKYLMETRLKNAYMNFNKLRLLLTIIRRFSNYRFLPVVFCFCCFWLQANCLLAHKPVAFS